MALARTTLTSACLATDTSIVVAAATGFAAGAQVLLDGERMHVSTAYVAGALTAPVIRGEGGTIVSAHPVTASVVVGSAADWTANPAAQTVVQYPIGGRARTETSYSASGAIALPTPGADALAILNGTSVLVMTLAVPTKDMDGSVLTIIGNGKAAHTVTVAGAGFGAASTGYTVVTFNSGGTEGFVTMAMNELWVLLSPMTGTLTAVVPALA